MRLLSSSPRPAVSLSPSPLPRSWKDATVSGWLLGMMLGVGSTAAAAAAETEGYYEYGAAALGQLYQLSPDTGAVRSNFSITAPVPAGASAMTAGFNGNGLLYYMGNSVGNIYAIDGRTGFHFSNFIPPQFASPVAAIAGGPNNTLFYNPGQTPMIYRLNGSTGAVISSFQVSTGLSGLPALAFGYDLDPTHLNGVLYHAVGGLNLVYKYDAVTGQSYGSQSLPPQVPLTAAGIALAYDLDRSQLVCVPANFGDGFRLDPRNLAALSSFKINAVGGRPAIAVMRAPIITMSTLGDAHEAQPGTLARFRVMRDKSSDFTKQAVITYAVGGTATNGVDYKLLSQTVTIAVGASSADILVGALQDTSPEDSETVTIRLVDVGGYKNGASVPQTVMVFDDDAITVTASTTIANAMEPGTQGAVTFTRNAALSAPTDVAYQIAATSTAMAGSDFQNLSGSALIPAGATSVVVPIIPLDDLLPEGGETVILQIVPNGYLIGSPNSAQVTIGDNDVPTVTIAATTPAASEPGPGLAAVNGVFTITRSGTGSTGTALPVGFGYIGSASPGADFTSIGAMATIPAGATSVTVAIRPLADLLIEGPETAMLNLTAGPGYNLGGSTSATVTIADRGIMVNFQLAGAAVPAGYVADTGLTLQAQNGLSYGWNTNHADVTRDRNVNADQRLDTLCHFHAGGIWAIALPNGSYQVKVSIGDAANPSTHTLRVEGTTWWNAQALVANAFLNQIRTVTVSDGYLTVDQSTAIDKATRINYLEISKAP